MDLPLLRKKVLEFPGAYEVYPFGPDTLVFMVQGKMFLLTQPQLMPDSMNLKCDPDDSLALRAEYPQIKPGYHMNKKHWITVPLDGTVPENLLADLITDSYKLVVAGLPRRNRDQLNIP